MAVPNRKKILRVPRKRPTGMPLWLLDCGHLLGSWLKVLELPCPSCVRNIPPDIIPLHRVMRALCPTCRDGVVDEEDNVNEKALTLMQSEVGGPLLYQHAVKGEWVLCEGQEVRKLIETILAKNTGAIS